MVSEIQSISSAGRIAAPLQAEGARAPSAQPMSPKVTAPKPVELNFDEAKARKNLQEAVSALNEQMASSKTGLGFSVDESQNRPVVTVRNAETGEVVRQIPTDVVLRMGHSIDAMKGLLLNAKV
jgi:flagellar protein FlaG